MAEHPGGGATEASNEASNATAGAHAPVAHEPPEHGGAELGPVDWAAWIAGAIGVVAGLIVIAAFFVAGRS